MWIRALRPMWLYVSLAAVMILAPAAWGAAPSNNQLQLLIKETSSQFDLALRFRPAEGRARQAELQAVIAAWRKAPQSEVNNERLAEWLRGAIQASMPGSRQALPAVPKFAGENGANNPKTTNSRQRVNSKPHTSATARSAAASPVKTNGTESTPSLEPQAPKTADESTDPFLDDPIGTDE
jgi:hypothetical protein